MKCENCKKETTQVFTSSKDKLICSQCLEQEIYKTRKNIVKKHKKRVKFMDNMLIGILIGFGISYITLMVLMLIKIIFR